VEGLADGAGDVLGLGDQEVVLGDRVGDPGDVGFLEPVGADQAGGDLAGDRDHRHRVHVGVGERRDQVGGARSAGRHAHPGPPGRLRVAGGRVPRALLVADQDVPDLLGVEQRVVGRQDRAAGNAEDHVDADPLQGEDQGLGPGDPGRGLARGYAAGRRSAGRRWLERGGLRRPGRGAAPGCQGGCQAPAETGGRRLSGGCPRRDVQRGGSVRLGGTGLLCSVIGWLPCHDVLCAGWGIKKPLVPGGSRGARAGTGLVSSLRASQVRGCDSASRIHPHPQGGLTSNYHGSRLMVRRLVRIFRDSGRGEDRVTPRERLTSMSQ
jgi:hypothetical protein